MDIQKLKYFYVVAQYEHITRAAEELHISQPSLTQAIHTLERELSVPLLKRQGRRVVLTEFGIYLKSRLEKLLPELDALPDELMLLKQQVNRTVKLNILAASAFVIESIVEYRMINPDVVFDFEQNTRNQECDIIITTHASIPNDVHTDPCCFAEEEPILLAVPRESVYADHPSIDLARVKNEGFVMLTNTRMFGTLCNTYCTMAGFVPKILFESDSPVAVQNIISTGTGVAFWPKYTWGNGKNDSVSLLPITNPDCKRVLLVELKKRVPSSLYAEDFYHFLVRKLKKIFGKD